jgi:hypothetical protein
VEDAPRGTRGDRRLADGDHAGHDLYAEQLEEMEGGEGRGGRWRCNWKRRRWSPRLVDP